MTKKSGRSVWPLSAMTAALALTLVVTACSSSGTTAASSAAAPAASAATGGVAAAKTALAEYKSFDQKFAGPSTPYDQGTGTVAIISYGESVPVINDTSKGAKEAFEAAGWKVTGPFDGKFSPPVISGFIDDAVQNKVDAIMLVIVTYRDQAAAIDRALAAGIAVSALISEPSDFVDAGVADKINLSTVDFTRQGKMMATWAVANSDGNVNAVITVDSGSFATVKRADGNKQAFAEFCPDTCKAQDLTIPAADISKPGPPQWTAFVGANPVDSGINYAFGEADVLAIPMYKTLKDIGRTDITMIGYDADAEAVSLMTQPDSKYGATSGLPFTYAAWAGADLAMRQKAGAEMYDASSLPIILVDKENAAQYTPYFAPPGDWRKTFTSLWQG